MSYLAGCVGSVEQGSKNITESADVTLTSDLRFDGVKEILPTAHDKIEVYFYSASGGSKNYVYQIYVGNQPQPVSVTEQVLEKDYRGLYRYTLTGLDIGTEYVVKVDVRDSSTDEIYSTSVAKTTYTFSNYVADFRGISSVSNLSGYAGVDSIKVRWPHATIFPANLFGSDRDPIAYEITILDSAKLSPAAFNDFTLGFPEGRLTRTVNYDPLVNEATIRGLEEGKLYYVNVRCIHKGSVDDPNNPRLKFDLNNRYYEIKTLVQSSANIEFDEDKYDLDHTAGEHMATSLQIKWGEIIGVFDHLRVYYAINPALSVVTNDPCAIVSASELLSGDTGCKKLDVSATSSILTDLSNNEMYQAELLICLDPACNENVRRGILQEETGSVVAGFSGITEIQLANDLSEIGTMNLYYTRPDFTDGYFNGLAVEYTAQKSELLAWINDPTFPKPATEIITASDYPGINTVDPFNYRWDNKVTVNGIKYEEATTYCFTIYPFIYDSQGDKVYKDEAASWSCKTTQIITSSKKEFKGFTSGNVVGNDIYLYWAKPTTGIYTHFEIFVKESTGFADSVYSYANAIQDTTVDYDFTFYDRYLYIKDNGYDEFDQPQIRTSAILNNFPNGHYLIGILTYVNVGVVARSEENLDIYRCVVNGALTDCIPL